MSIAGNIAARRKKWQPTPLNLKTDQRYRACLERGGHVPSGKSVSRDLDGSLVDLWICRRCAVPIGKSPLRRVHWKRRAAA